MTAMKKLGLLALILAVLALLLWWGRQPQLFTLQLHNQSGRLVERVSLLDSAVLEEVSLERLAPDARAELVVALKNEGVLRFQVEQGLNRLDGIIAADVSRLQQHRQLLTIYPDNRLLLSSPEPER